MSKKDKKPKKKGKREAEEQLGREVPWVMLLQGGLVLARQWRSMADEDRARVRRLLNESRGRVGRLSTTERAELRKLARELDLKSVARELLPLAKGVRSRRRRPGA